MQTMNLFFLMLILLFFGGCNGDWQGNEVTVYSMFCTEGRVNGLCKSKEETANTTTYKVFVEQQTVVYWTGNSQPTRFTFCAVRDSHNWTCKYERAEGVPSTEYRMADGEYTEEVFEPSPWQVPNIFYPVSRWHWWKVWLSERL